LTFDELVDLQEITSGRERAIDVEDYKVGGARRYAVVTVNNSGNNATGWWWYFNASKTFIKNNLEDRRIIDLDRRPGTSKYDVIMISNTGDDARKWWYYYTRTPAQIKDLLKAKKGRLVDIERDGSKYTIVMVRRSGEYWWWYHGIKATRVSALLAQNGARLIDIERYDTDNGKRYAVIMLNDLDALSTRVREIMRPGAKKASFGFYLKEVGGPVWAALQHNHVFEPASTTKVLHHLTAMQAVQDARASLTEDITWFVRPDDDARYPGDSDYSDDKNKCAYESDGTPIASNSYVDELGEVILRQMMEQSDNRATDAVLNRFGFNAINDTADDVGMTNTELNHRIGCPRDASPNYARNELTLFDAGLLYEGVSNGSLIGTGVLRNTFYDYMLNGVGGWKSVVDEEASDLGLSQAVADDFLEAMTAAVKGGSYTNSADCPSGVSGECKLVRRTGFGRLSLPFKFSPTGAPILKDYLYGSFVDGEFECGNNCDGEIELIGEVRTQAHFEMMRPRIRAALETW
ncbi:MAG: serine hydrolase, partial [Actinomycetota bacterium]